MKNEIAAAPVDLAWAAGIIDGEGCITLTRRSASGDRIYHAHTLVLTVTNTDPEMLVRLQEIFGCGRIFARKQYAARVTWRPCWIWTVVSRQAEGAIRAVIPYLVSKRKQAEIAIQSRALINQRGRAHNQNLSELERMAGELSALKHEVKAR